MPTTANSPAGNLPPAVHYLATRIAELEAALAMLLDQAAAKDARIAELEQARPDPTATGKTSCFESP